jgi:hypothetical protein
MTASEEAAILTAPPPEATRRASNATFEQATSAPEAIDINDGQAVHLTDDQLTSPMRGILDRCSVPRNAKVTIKTAVQNGRAIGVTVDVVFDIAKPKKRPSKSAAAAEARAAAKAKARIINCADHAVRAVTWPPSRRRDSFTTVF